MQNIFIEKPYRFLRPVMPKWLPWLMNNRLVHWPLLRFTESIVSVESHGVDCLRQSLDADHAIMMIGNHPRVSDPVVMYDLIRKADTTMFAMASWHLFNQNWFNTAVLRLYGAYSVNREGFDREAINFSVDSMVRNVRPVLMFPEGATTRTNDSLMPFLEGPTFIARTVSRRRHKQNLKTVIHPVSIRYQFLGDFQQELSQIMEQVEQILGVSNGEKLAPAQRVLQALDAFTLRKETEFGVAPDQNLSSFDRRQRLVDEVMKQAELRCFGEASEKNITNRIRDVRAEVFPVLLEDKTLSQAQREIHWQDLERTYFAWLMACYPRDYLAGEPSNDRILEIAVKILEDLTDKPHKHGKQKVVIECGEAIEVPPKKSRGHDPLADEIANSLSAMSNRAP